MKSNEELNAVELIEEEMEQVCGGFDPKEKLYQMYMNGIITKEEYRQMLLKLRT